MCDVTSWFHVGTVFGMWVSSRLLEFKNLPQGTRAARLRRLMDERALPSGLAEQEQPHCGAKQWALNIFTPELHTLQTMKSWSGPGMRIGYERAELSRTVSVVDTFHTQTHNYLQAPVRPHLHTRDAWGMSSMPDYITHLYGARVSATSVNW